jgi:hypothetical protein
MTSADGLGGRRRWCRYGQAVGGTAGVGGGTVGPVGGTVGTADGVGGRWVLAHGVGGGSTGHGVGRAPGEAKAVGSGVCVGGSGVPDGGSGVPDGGSGVPVGGSGVPVGGSGVPVGAGVGTGHDGADPPSPAGIKLAPTARASGVASSTAATAPAVPSETAARRRRLAW